MGEVARQPNDRVTRVWLGATIAMSEELVSANNGAACLLRHRTLGA